MPRQQQSASIAGDPQLSRPVQTASPGPARSRVWVPGSHALAPRALWASLLILAAVAITWYLQQRIGAFLLLVGMIGFGAWRVTGALFRPATVADWLLLAITTAAAWIVLVAEVLSAGRLLGRPIA